MRTYRQNVAIAETPVTSWCSTEIIAMTADAHWFGVGRLRACVESRNSSACRPHTRTLAIYRPEATGTKPGVCAIVHGGGVANGVVQRWFRHRIALRCCTTLLFIVTPDRREEVAAGLKGGPQTAKFVTRAIS